MVTRRDIDFYQAGTRSLNKKMQTRLRGLAESLDWSDPDKARTVLEYAFDQLMTAGGQAVGQASAEWYNRIREEELGEAFTVRAPMVKNAHNSKAAIGWAFKNIEGLGRAELIRQVADRLGDYLALGLKQYSAQTIMGLVETDPVRPRWARVPKGRTCAWCAMLASRGWVYHSAESAGAVANSFHRDCDCQIVPNWDDKKRRIDGYDPDELYDEYKRAWRKNDTDAQTVARMRQLYPGRYSDSRKLVLPARKPGGSYIIPDGHDVEPHEIVTAKALIEYGYKIIFRKLSYEDNQKNPDVLMNGEIWEFKSPEGSSRKGTIKKQIRRGKKQASKLVIDLRRSGLPDYFAYGEVKTRFFRQDAINEIMLIGHKGDLIAHFSKNGVQLEGK